MSKTITRTAAFKVTGWLCLLLVLVGYSLQSGAQNLPQAQPGGSAPVLMAQLGHSIPILTVAFSPDGKYVATGSNDYTACLWQTDTGRQIRRYEGHTGVVDTVAFTPDGKQVLTGSEGGTASRWQTDTGRLIRKLDVQSSDISSVAFSADGKYVLTGSKDGAASQWQLETGKLIRKFEGEYGTVLSVAFSPDDKYVLTGSDDKTASLWQTDTGNRIRKFEGHSGSVNSVAFSPNGKYVLTGSDDKTTSLWQTDTGNRIRKFVGHSGSVNSVAFSPDGAYLLTGSQDKTACLWQTATGEQVRKFEGHSDSVTSVAFSHDGKYVLTGSEDGTARQWQLETGRLVRKFVGHSDAVSSVAVSRDGRYVLTGGADKTACLWDTHTGKRVRKFARHSNWVISVAFSPDGKYVMTGSQDKTACLWETETGKLICTFNGHSDPISSVAFSPDGKYVLTGSEDKTARLWQAGTGKFIRKFVGHSDLVSSVAFSPDGKYVLTGSYDKTARLWQMETGELIRKYEGHSEAIWSAVFSPDGKYVLTGSDDKTARLWEAETGVQIRKFDGHSEPVSSVAFSADGKYVLTGSSDKTGRLWQTDTGKQVRMFDTNSSIITSVAFTPDSRYVLIASADGTTRIWNGATGQELCCLISFDDGTWAVTDNQGRYDASNEGDVSGLHWVVDTGKGPYAVPLDRLKARYYDPGLLAKYMEFNTVALRPVEKFAGTAPPPEITASAPAGSGTKLSISVVNAGGGIGAVQVLVNGKEVTADARGAHPNPDFSPQKLTVDLTDAPLRPGKINDITIISRNRDGSWASDPYHIAWKSPVNAARGPTLPARPTAPATANPELFAVVAGIDNYSGGEVRPLTFPDADARQIAKALSLGADRLLGPGHFHLSMLSDQSAKEAELPTGALLLTPTRKHFETVFADLAKKVRPTDILVIYLSGHGTAFVDPASNDAIKDTYCYLTQEANSFDVRDDKVRATCAITSKELATWTDAHHIQALKQVLILDTCYAGSAKNDLVVRRADAAEQEIATRALSDTKDRTSFFVLMGCARDAVSYETSQFGQGLLTYALLRGLQGDQLKNGEFVDVAPWFEYAAHLVPELAREIGSAQAPQVMQRTDVSGSDASDHLQASSFSIGRLTAADKEQIQLPQPHPLVMRPSFLDETGEDDLKLSVEVRRLLLANSFAAGRGAQSSVVYVDANPEDSPGGIAVTGNYRQENQNWTVHLVVRKGAQRVLETVAAGKDELAAKVLAAIESIVVGFK